MRNLAIDMGNTRAKVGVFNSTKMQEVLIDQSLEALLRLIDHQQIKKVIISSVGQNPYKIAKELEAMVPCIVLGHATKVPIINKYESPQTLGMDRLAAVIGAHARFPHTNCLVIDAGTSITYDFIDKEANYMGGGISPGIDLRFRALNDHTSRLPLLRDKSKTPLIGTTTESAIRSGVINGMLSEIEGMLQRYAEKFSNLQALLCGGDAAFFESMLKAPIFVIPNLVLIGLNAILLHNVQTD